ncbi:MAG: hypothetical protein NWF07_11535 [Candidatus Bathyarchaeota archaeon]|nr:hypothetical protein [Candidatus Bathyarchaeota archaeon]
MEKLVHTPNNHPEWNESFYFCFSDRENKINAMTRLGMKPNKDEASLFFLVFLPDGSVAGYRDAERIHGEWGSHEWVSKGMEFTPNEDGSWHYAYTGPMVQVEKPGDFPHASRDKSLIKTVLPTQMDIHFKPIHPEYEYSENMTPESLEIGKKAGDEHWEQIGLIEGTLTLGETSYKISRQIGQRDHTYGVRDWTGVGDWLYYVVWFNEELAANPAAIVMEDGRVSWGGFIYKDGINQPIVEMRVLDQQFYDGIIPISSKLELVTSDGKTHLLEGKAGPTVPLPFFDESGKMSVLAQCFGEFTLDGITGGYGSFETLRVKR